MKKFTICLLALVACGLCACGNTDNSSDNNETSTTKAVEINESTDSVQSETFTKTDTTTNITAKGIIETTTEPEKPEYANEETLSRDLEQYVEVAAKANLKVTSLEIEKRLTTEETKEDIVYVKAFLESDDCTAEINTTMKYLKFNDGWGYDSLEVTRVYSEPKYDLTEKHFEKLFNYIYLTSNDKEPIELNGIFTNNDGDYKYVVSTYSFDALGNTIYSEILQVYQMSEYRFSINWNSEECCWKLYKDVFKIDNDGLLGSYLENGYENIYNLNDIVNS